jgi:hypothetical protein
MSEYLKVDILSTKVSITTATKAVNMPTRSITNQRASCLRDINLKIFYLFEIILSFFKLIIYLLYD